MGIYFCLFSLKLKPTWKMTYKSALDFLHFFRRFFKLLKIIRLEGFELFCCKTNFVELSGFSCVAIPLNFLFKCKLQQHWLVNWKFSPFTSKSNVCYHDFHFSFNFYSHFRSHFLRINLNRFFFMFLFDLCIFKGILTTFLYQLNDPPQKIKRKLRHSRNYS